MTLPERSLHPAGGDDRGALLRTLELAARRGVQLGKVVGAIVDQGMTLEPCPEVLHWIQIRRVRRQEGDLNVRIQGVQIVANQTAAVCLQAIPEDQQRLLQMSLECLEECDDLLFLDAAFVQAEQTLGAGEPGNDRDVMPVEVKLDDRRLTLQRPRANPGRPFADARFVDEDDQSAFPLGFF